MTTICYRDGILAADTRAYSGDRNPIGQKQKIWQIRRADGSVVSVGVSTSHPGLAEEIRQWFLSEKSRDFEPVLQDRSFYALEVTQDGKVFFYRDSFVPSGPLEAEYFSIGSGCEYALGAMACGANAQEAVIIASRFDNWTGGTVQHVVVVPQEQAEAA